MGQRQGLRVGFVFTLMMAILCSSLTLAAPGPQSIGQEDLIYFIMTDRFCDGDPANNQNVRKNDPAAYHGGDFQGIITKLDYLKELGFTTIWISPVAANQVGGYHGYWAVDFYRTNEHFGSLEKLKELVEKAHAKGIKVMLDLVVNHTGSLHPWASDSGYQNWFHQRGNIINYNDEQEVEEGRLAGLPDLNQENPAVNKYLIDMAKWWIRETGIDGYRLDTVKHVSKSFWKEFAAEIKKEFPDFYLLGEVFDGRIDYLADYQRAGLDGLADFPIYYAVNELFGSYYPAGRFVETVNRCTAAYPNPFLMGTFIDNHDVPRFINQLPGLGRERLKQALAFIMTYTGIPIIYYGTEIELDGGADPDNRRDMDWSAKSPLTDYVKRLTAIRKANKALTYGDFQIIKAEQDFLCYGRRLEANILISVFNLSDRRKRFEISLPAKFQNKGLLTELTGYQSQKINNGKVRITMGPRQAYIFSYSQK